MNPMTRILILLLVLIGSFAVYVHFSKNETTAHAQTSSSPPKKAKVLDDKTNAEIEALIKDVEVTPGENNLQYAIKLDHGTGRKELNKGNKKRAFEIYQKVLAISYRNNSLMGMGIALGVLSDLIKSMDSNDQALRIGFLSYKVGKAMNKPEEYGVAELRLAYLTHREDRAMAMKWRMKAKESLKNTRYKQDYIALLKELASDSRWLGYDEKAQSIIEEAWSRVITYGDSTPIKQARFRVASTYSRLLHDQGDYSKALDILNHSLNDFTGDRKQSDDYYSILYSLGENHASMGQAEKAIYFYSLAYSHYEQDRSKALGDRARAKLDTRNTFLVNRLIDAHVANDDLYSALAILETSKARTLSDISEDLQQVDVYRQLTELKRKHASQRVALMEKYKSAYARPGYSDLEGVVKFKLGEHGPKFSEYMSEFEQLLEQQRRESDSLNIQVQRRTVPVAESLDPQRVQSIQKSLKPNQAILSIYASNETAQLFVLTQKRIQFVSTEMREDEFVRLIKVLRAALLNPHFDLYKSPAKKLSESILAPVISNVDKQIDTLIISPDGIFSRIPMGVLPIGDQFLTERFQVTRIPSMQYLRDSLSNPSARRGIACVDPDIYDRRLPFQQQTGNQLSRMFGKNLQLLSGKNCNALDLEHAIQTTKKPSFLHMGAHGIFYPGNAMESGIYLTSERGGELWQAREIASNPFNNIDLVTLGSPETALSGLKNKRDVFGIIRALKFAGAKQIVAPLWVVDDQATSVLMRDFYTHYAANEPLRHSLIAAQRQMIESEHYRHPYYWAGYVLTESAL